MAGILYSADFPPYHSNTYDYFGGLNPTQVLTGDFNQDGKLDVVMGASCSDINLPGCPAGGSIVAVFLGKGDGSFQSPILSGTELPPALRSITVGDFNHDGKLDVAVASDCLTTQNCATGLLTILLGDGTGSLKQSSKYSLNGIVSDANTIVAGDFTHDGYADGLAVGIGCFGASCLGKIAVYLGEGNGSLKSPVYYPATGNTAIFPAVGDFNGDGAADIVFAYNSGGSEQSSLEVLLNTGSGSFMAKPTVTLPSGYPQAVAVADLNGDGVQDLAVLTYESVQVLAGKNIDGKGNGTFEVPAVYTVGYDNSSIAVSDLNGDGKPDLVVGSTQVSAIPLVNNGKGAFSVGANYPLGGWDVASIVTGDFNMDGKQDVVLTSLCSEDSGLDNHCPDGTLGVILGNGDGTLQGAVPADLTPFPHFTVLADMNGDGILDLVSTEDYYEGNAGNGGGVFVSLGTGGGLFDPAMEFRLTLSNPTGLAVADLNKDGHPDVIVTGSLTSTSAVAVLLGEKGGSLRSPSIYPLQGYSPGSPVVADFAGNERLSVAVVDQSQNGGSSGVGVLMGEGNGILKPEIFTATNEIFPFSLVAGDFNKDGKADLAVYGEANNFASDGGVTVLQGTGTGIFNVRADPDHNPSSNYFANCTTNKVCTFLESYPTDGLLTESSGIAPIATADLDGDGILDLVIANPCRLNDSSCSTGELVYYHGLGNGTFNMVSNTTPVEASGDANYLGVSVADVNNDGKPDIVATTLTGVAVYLAPFTTPPIIYATSDHYDAEVPAIGDINGDGAPDIAIGNSTTVELLYNRIPATEDKGSTTATSQHR